MNINGCKIIIRGVVIGGVDNIGTEYKVIKMKHTVLTKKVIELMSQNNNTLLEQFNVATSTEESNDSGYYVDFKVNNTVSPLSTNKLPSIIGKNKDGKIIVGFVMFVKNGYIDCFEGYTFGDEKWPNSDGEISIEIAK